MTQWSLSISIFLMILVDGIASMYSDLLLDSENIEVIPRFSFRENKLLILNFFKPKNDQKKRREETKKFSLLFVDSHRCYAITF